MTEPDDLLRRLRAIDDKWEWRIARNRKASRWALIPHGLGGLAAGAGISLVLDAELWLPAALLVFGFLALVSAQWAVPFWTEHKNMEEAATDAERRQTLRVRMMLVRMMVLISLAGGYGAGVLTMALQVPSVWIGPVLMIGIAWVAWGLRHREPDSLTRPDAPRTAQSE